VPPLEDFDMVTFGAASLLLFVVSCSTKSLVFVQENKVKMSSIDNTFIIAFSFNFCIKRRLFCRLHSKGRILPHSAFTASLKSSHRQWGMSLVDVEKMIVY
jgi:hypothetical protein